MGDEYDLENLADDCGCLGLTHCPYMAALLAEKEKEIERLHKFFAATQIRMNMLLRLAVAMEGLMVGDKFDNHLFSDVERIKKDLEEFPCHAEKYRDADEHPKPYREGAMQPCETYKKYGGVILVCWRCADCGKCATHECRGRHRFVPEKGPNSV